MNAVSIFGSPRQHGNSSILTNYFLSCLEEKGAHVERYYLSKMNYRGCQGCMGCKGTSDHCVLKDDLSPILDAMYKTDLLVLSSCVYFGDISSQLKGFVDRFYSFYVPEFWLKENKSRLSPGKKLLFVLTQGNIDEKLFGDIAPKYSTLLSTLGLTEHYLLRVCGIAPAQNILENESIVKQAQTLADSLMK